MAKLYVRKSDGTYVPQQSVLVSNLDVVQEKGDSLISVMSQKAVTDELAIKQDTISDLEMIRRNAQNASDVVTNMTNAGYLFAGIATLSTNPGVPEAKVFYIANGKGTYTNFGGLEVTENEVVVLYYDTAWHKEATGIASQAKLTELDKKIDALALGAFYGYFPDSSSLPTDVITPGYSYVGLDNPYKIWNFNGESWSDSGTSIAMNDADEEDITRNADGKLQFKDRSYGDGMGYVILRKDKSFAEQVSIANTIYEVRYDFDLEGETIEIPANCVLKFEGGKISSGGLLFRTDTLIDADNVHIFDNVTLLAKVPKGGSIKYKVEHLNVAWFGAVGDAVTDNYAIFQKAIDCAFNFGCPVVMPKGRYNISQTLELYNGSVIIGNSDNIQNTSNSSNLTLLSYSGEAGTSCMHVTDGMFIVLKNFGITNSTPYVCDGFTFEGSLSFTEIDNFNLYGCRYSIYGNLTSGFSENHFSNLLINYCSKGIFIESQTISSQYVTLNMMEHLAITSMKENAVYISSKTINSLKFIDCNIANIGMRNVYDASTSAINHSAIILSQTGQGSVSFENCYFEGIVYSPDTSVVSEYDYSQDAVVSISGMACTIISCRFADTLQIIKSAGNDNILLENCIDNGYNILIPYSAIVNIGGTSKITINGYWFSNKNKDVVYGALTAQNGSSNINIKGIKWANGVIEADTSYNREDSVHFYIGASDGSGIVSAFPISPLNILSGIASNVLKFIVEYVSDITLNAGATFQNTKGGELVILGNGHEHTISSSASSYAATFDINGFRKVSVSNLNWNALNAHPYFVRTNSAVVATFKFTKIVVLSLAAGGNMLVMSPETNLQFVEMVDVKNQSDKTLSSCNSYHTSTGVFEGNQSVIKQNDINSGVTSTRPSDVNVGHLYFDKSINKPVWWTGTKWVDAAGAEV